MRTTIRKLMLSSVLLSMVLLVAGAAYASPLYFPHVATSIPWQTEIAVINTGDQPVNGTLKGMSDEGQLIETKAVILSARGRKQIAVANEFTNHTAIGYIIFDTDSTAVQGYTKFYQAGKYRAAVPAVKEVNTSDIYISHIASNADWWTGVSLVNTTSETKVLTITFNNGQTRNITLKAKEHQAFSIRSLFNDQPQLGIESAVIANASGVIGLELFGSVVWETQLEGILLTDKTTSTLYYPHVASDDSWWTGIVAYNPSASTCTITITPYSAQGVSLTPSTLSIPGKGKYVGAVSQLGLPAQTAWFKIDSTNNAFTGFEIFGATNGQQLGAYAGGGGTGAKEGIFAKIEKNGWTGIAFVNTEANAASVTLTAYDDNGVAVATQVLQVPGHAKVVNNPELIFSQDINGATYIAYSSDRNVVGFQLNGSVDGTMLDGLPALASGEDGAAPRCYSEPEVMMTMDGVQFLRTPDDCFQNLPDFPYKARYVEIDGLRQGYVEEGPSDADPILLLHGQPSWSYLYRKMIPVLVDGGYRVIAMDHIGMGRSDKPIEIHYYRYLGHVNRLESFIETLNLKHITLFCQDWGSLIGLYVAGKHPEWFDRIVVGDGNLPVIPAGVQPYPPVENPDEVNTEIGAPFASIPPQQLPFYNEKGNRLIPPVDFGYWMVYAMTAASFQPAEVVEALTYFDLPPEEESAYDAPFPSRIYMAGPRVFPSLVNQLPGVTEDAWNGLTEFDKPFLTIWASNDPGQLGEQIVQDNLINSIPGAAGQPHIRLSEASHFLQDDQGVEIARLIIEFVKANPR